MGPRRRAGGPLLALVGASAAAMVVLLAGAQAATRSACSTGTLAAVDCAHVTPVPSLEPGATDLAWAALVQARRQRGGVAELAAAEDCRPVRAIFYAASDWLRLATKLAAGGSPCAQYFVSIPPLTADKTRPRPDQAWRIRALGPRFHALAEIHLATWAQWVSTNGATWHAAGVEARRRMAAAGYDVGGGDTWAVNEFSSAVRRGDGSARANAREFVRGLFEGDGALPRTRGVVWTTGVSQRTPDLSTYKANLQGWLQDAAFWTDMSAYVSEFSQENYGDTRSYAVPGVPLPTRRDLLNDYLQHELRLAATGPDSAVTARTYLQGAYSPLGNAAWGWDFGFGWTMVTLDQMQDFVSAQTYALRFDGSTRNTEDRWGLAWAPRNAFGLASGEFAAQTGLLLDRLAAAVRDSALPVVAGDPGAGACGLPAQNAWCVRELPGATVSDGWAPFNVWAQPALAFLTPPQTITAGGVTAPITVQLRVGGLPSATKDPLTVTVSSSSPAGAFAFVPEGPWTPTLALIVPAGGTTPPSFLYRDTRAGTSVVTAAAPGYLSASQPVTVAAGPPLALTVAPAQAKVRWGTSIALAARTVDAFGNQAPAATARWSVTPAASGMVTPTVGASTAFTGTVSGTVTVTATLPANGQLSGAASVVVLPPPRIRVTRVRYLTVGATHRVTVSVADQTGRSVSGAAVNAALYRNGAWYASVRGVTGPSGRVTFVRRARVTRAGCYTTRVRRVAATGYAWVPGTPANRFCKRTAPRR